MEVTIFKKITTEGIITSIEENSKKYNEGLVANMDNLPERTMVKKGAAEIGDIIKELKTSRIAITKANTAEVNKEHDAIVSRLVIANKPYTDLLDAYNVKRKKELAAEDARKQAILDAAKKENDHEMALLIDKTYAYDQEQLAILADKEEKRIEKEREECAAQQVKLAAQKIVDDQLQEAANKRHDDEQRLANVEHVRGINRAIFKGFIDAGLDKEAATIATQSLIDNKITHVKINY